MFKWTPVTEAMPTESGQYLVTFKALGGEETLVYSYSTDNDPTIWEAHFDEECELKLTPVDSGFYYYDEYLCVNHVMGGIIAWAPMPEPYKPEEATEIAMVEDDEYYDKKCATCEHWYNGDCHDYEWSSKCEIVQNMLLEMELEKGWDI